MPASQIRGLYNPRGDNENCYDELKNQWGWGGFTLKDLARSELMARLIALIYNWWSIHIKRVDPLVAREAITPRPMYLMHTAKASTHQNVRTLVIFCAHSQAIEKIVAPTKKTNRLPPVGGCRIPALLIFLGSIATFKLSLPPHSVSIYELRLQD